MVERNSNSMEESVDQPEPSISYQDCQARIRMIRDKYRRMAVHLGDLKEDNLAYFHQEFKDIYEQYKSKKELKIDDLKSHDLTMTFDNTKRKRLSSLGMDSGISISQHNEPINCALLNPRYTNKYAERNYKVNNQVYLEIHKKLSQAEREKLQDQKVLVKRHLPVETVEPHNVLNFGHSTAISQSMSITTPIAAPPTVAVKSVDPLEVELLQKMAEMNKPKGYAKGTIKTIRI